MRKKWFNEFLAKNPKPDINSIVNFHETGGTGDLHNDLVMNRENLFTVSITSIKKSEEGIFMMYKDLPADTKYQIRVM